MPLQRTADGVARQGPQQLPSGLLVGGRHLIVDEGGLVDLAAFGGRQQFDFSSYYVNL